MGKVKAENNMLEVCKIGCVIQEIPQHYIWGHSLKIERCKKRLKKICIFYMVDSELVILLPQEALRRGRWYYQVAKGFGGLSGEHVEGRY